MICNLICDKRFFDLLHSYLPSLLLYFLGLLSISCIYRHTRTQGFKTPSSNVPAHPLPTFFILQSITFCFLPLCPYPHAPSEPPESRRNDPNSMSAFLFGEIPSIIRCNSLPEVLVCLLCDLYLFVKGIHESLRCSVLRENRDNHHSYLRLSAISALVFYSYAQDKTSIKPCFVNRRFN